MLNQIITPNAKSDVKTGHVQLYLPDSAYDDIKQCATILNELGYTVNDLEIQLFPNKNYVITSRQTYRKLKDNDIIIWLIENGIQYANQFMQDIGVKFEIRDMGYDIKSHIEEFGHKPKQKNLKIRDESRRDLMLAHTYLKTTGCIDEDGNAIKLNRMIINMMRFGRKEFCKIYKVKIQPLVFK